jgi:hypothetical protein
MIPVIWSRKSAECEFALVLYFPNHDLGFNMTVDLSHMSSGFGRHSGSFLPQVYNILPGEIVTIFSSRALTLGSVGRIMACPTIIRPTKTERGSVKWRLVIAEASFRFVEFFPL